MKIYVVTVWYRVNPWGEDWTEDNVCVTENVALALSAPQTSDHEGNFYVQIWQDGRMIRVEKMETFAEKIKEN